MKLVSNFVNSICMPTITLVSLIAILAVFGPFISVSGGFWDAVNHLVNDPEFFWSIQHMVVYFGVSLVASAGFLGILLLIKKSVHGTLKTGILLVVVGAAIQLVAGFVDSISHDVYGIDGLISWTHQPLELGLVLAALGGFQVFKLLGYEIIPDIDVDQDPNILKKYDKVILLHNEYVTKREFDAITNHPNVFFLYPNALYAEVKIDYDTNLLTLQRGHNFPESHMANGFDWKFDNNPLEYNIDCKDMGFDRIKNGWMLNCYPERPIHQSKVLLNMIKEF